MSPLKGDQQMMLPELIALLQRRGWDSWSHHEIYPISSQTLSGISNHLEK